MQTVLVVEDDEAVAETMMLTLVEEGFQVVVASDGMSALDCLAHYTPGVIVADIGMPNMNGYQFYQRVRRNPAWEWIPVIFVTGKADPEDIRYARELGVDDYLSKPFDPQDLVTAVGGRLRRFAELQSAMTGKPPRARPRPTGRHAIGDLVVDLARCHVSVAGVAVRLSPTEFHILRRLILGDGAVVSYEELLAQRSGETLDAHDAAGLLRGHIRNMRRKLKETGAPCNLIANVRGVGYRLTELPLLLK